jgi:hypothetical protein
MTWLPVLTSDVPRVRLSPSLSSSIWRTGCGLSANGSRPGVRRLRPSTTCSGVGLCSHVSSSTGGSACRTTRPSGRSVELLLRARTGRLPVLISAAIEPWHCTFCSRPARSTSSTRRLGWLMFWRGCRSIRPSGSTNSCPRTGKHRVISRPRPDLRPFA